MAAATAPPGHLPGPRFPHPPDTGLSRTSPNTLHEFTLPCWALKLLFILQNPAASHRKPSPTTTQSCRERQTLPTSCSSASCCCGIHTRIHGPLWWTGAKSNSLRVCRPGNGMLLPRASNCYRSASTWETRVSREPSTSACLLTHVRVEAAFLDLICSCSPPSAQLSPDVVKPSMPGKQFQDLLSEWLLSQCPIVGRRQAFSGDSSELRLSPGCSEGAAGEGEWNYRQVYRQTAQQARPRAGGEEQASMETESGRLGTQPRWAQNRLGVSRGQAAHSLCKP